MNHDIPIGTIFLAGFTVFFIGVMLFFLLAINTEIWKLNGWRHTSIFPKVVFVIATIFVSIPVITVIKLLIFFSMY